MGGSCHFSSSVHFVDLPKMPFGGLAASISLKLCSSIDDVIWLAPFLTANISYGMKVLNSICYIFVCGLQTILSVIIARCGDKAVKMAAGKKKGAWSAKKILTVGAGVFLAFYTA